MPSPSLSDFAPLIQLGAGLNFGVSFLYQSFEVELNRLHQKLKVLEDSAVLIGDSRDAFLASRKAILRQVQIAAKSLTIPNKWLVRILMIAGGYCVVLLLVVGYEPKNPSAILRYSGIFASIAPVPIGWLIHRWFVKNAFRTCWKDIHALESKYFQ
jgi:hypothetical protein